MRSTISRRRRRSRSESMRRDTPTRCAQGVSTRWRPAIETWEVMRAPLVPIGSFATWTRISWPSWSRRADVRRRRRRAVAAAPPRAAVAAAVLAVEALDVLDVVAGVEEGGLLEADVHEGGLHAGEHAGHAALHDVRDHAAASWRARCGARRAGPSRGSPRGSRPGVALIRISFCIRSRTGGARGRAAPALASPRPSGRECRESAPHARRAWGSGGSRAPEAAPGGRDSR